MEMAFQHILQRETKIAERRVNILTGLDRRKRLLGPTIILLITFVSSSLALSLTLASLVRAFRQCTSKSFPANSSILTFLAELTWLALVTERIGGALTLTLLRGTGVYLRITGGLVLLTC
jgi:hypothetical protein